MSLAHAVCCGITLVSGWSYSCFVFFFTKKQWLVHGQVTIIFVVSVCLFICLSVFLFVCAEFFSAVFDLISIKLGHMLYVWV